VPSPKWPPPIVDEFLETVASGDRRELPYGHCYCLGIFLVAHTGRSISTRQIQKSTMARWHRRSVAHSGINRTRQQIAGGALDVSNQHWPHEIPTDIRERLNELNGYPNVGEIRAVRPTVRSMEGVIDTMNAPGDRAWPTAFWKQCHGDTTCLRPDKSKDAQPSAVNMLERVYITYAALAAMQPYPKPPPR